MDTHPVAEEDLSPSEIVRRGYDALSLRYRADDAPIGQYGPWLEEIQRRVPPGGRVLDVGCGCGVPVARELTAHAYQVTGIDLSAVQVQRARTLVPRATFIQGDVTTLDWPAASFEAIVALYSIIHVPLSRQSALLTSMAKWLIDDGILLLTAGAQAWTGSQVGWLGGTDQMWWSQADATTYCRWLDDAGFTVISEAYVPEGGDGGHSLFWAIRHRGASSIREQDSDRR